MGVSWNEKTTLLRWFVHHLGQYFTRELSESWFAIAVVTADISENRRGITHVPLQNMTDMGRQDTTDPEAALDYLAKNCRWAVVTLGSNGCIAKHDNDIVRVPAIGEAQTSDATGAGDLFASGFLYGMVKGLSLEQCCRAGSCSGGSVIRSLGGDVTPENRKWMFKQMHIKGLPVPDNVQLTSLTY